jgi:hypothetical protein
VSPSAVIAALSPRICLTIARPELTPIRICGNAKFSLNGWGGSRETFVNKQRGAAGA